MDKSKLCPFSLSFAVPVRQLPGIIPGQNKMSLSVGIPCLKEKCAGYKEDEKFCVPIGVTIK